MANWSNPQLTSTYTNFVTEVKDRDTDLALQFDGTTSSNIPTNAIRWNSSINRWQKWNGSAWGELTSTYALTGLSTTGNATIGGTLGSGAFSSSGTVTGTALIPTSSSVPTNGLYLAGTNTLGLATNSLSRLLVDGSGQVGIGLSPGTSLDVRLNAASALVGNIRIAPTTAGQARYHLYNGGATAEWLFGQKTSTNHDFTLSTSVAGSETDLFTVTTGGNVGVNTTTPYSALTVIPGVNPVTVAQANQITVGEASRNSGYRLQLGYFLETVFKGSIQAYDNNNPTTLVLNGAGGNVGIGTSSPGTKLEVAGQIRALDTVDLRLNPIPASNAGIVGTYSSHDLVFYRNNAESFRIGGSGNVGIGLTNPTTGLEIGKAAPSAAVGNVRIRPPSAGQARLHFYNEGGQAEWLIGQTSGTDHGFSITKNVAGSQTEYFQIGTVGQVGLSSSYGTAGQVLTSNGSGAAASWTDIAPLTSGTAVASTSGTSIDFTNIPSWAKRITVMMDSVSFNAATIPTLQLGDSGGIETTGYVGGYAYTGQSTGSAGSSSSLPFAVASAGDNLCGHLIITKITGSTWVMSGTVVRENDDYVFVSGGSKTTSATLDRIRITTTGGTDTFDAGTINILYE